MASMCDRGDSYKVQYLGSNMLTLTGLTGLGVLQKPLKEMYFRFRQDAARASVRLQERHLTMNDHGMLMTYQGSGNKPGEQEFYSMPDILFWDAVKFVTIKGSDRKLRSAFGPLDNTHSRNKDNLFATLEKPFQFLHQQKHPPLFCCVLRRTQGIKALDVHAFVCHTAEESIGLVRALNGVSSSYASDEQQETGVFGYNPFGKESVRSAAGLEDGRLSPERGDPDIQHQFILRSPGDSADHSPSHGAKAARSVSVRDKHSPVKSPGRPAATDINLFTGSQPNLASVSRAGPSPGAQPSAHYHGQSAGTPRDRNSRVFMLSQSDFIEHQSGSPKHRDVDSIERARSSPPRRAKSEKVNRKSEQKETYDYIQHINRTLERPDQRRSPRIDTPTDESNAREEPIHYRSSSGSTDKHSVRSNLSFVGGGIFQEDNNFSGKRKSKPSGHSPNADKSMGQGYSLMSSSSGVLPGYAPHQNTRRPYAPSPTEQDRSASPTYQHTISRNSRPYGDNPEASVGRDQHNTAETYENLKDLSGSLRARQELLSRSGPGQYQGPNIPPRSPILRKSESVRRDVNISPERRSTTQGTVMAQVTPQSQRGSSPFANRRGPPGINRDSAPFPRGADTPGASRSNQEAQVHSKPVAKVPPHKIQGVKVLPSQPSLPKRDVPLAAVSGNIHQRQDHSAVTSSQNNVNTAPKRPNSMFVDNNFGSGRKINQFVSEQKGYSPLESSPIKDIYAVPKKGSQKQRSKDQIKPKQDETNWQFQRTPPKDNSKSNNARGTPGDTEGQVQGESMIQSEKKDAEIASLLQNIQFDYEGTLSPHAPHGTNFEKSLGYFP